MKKIQNLYLEKRCKEIKTTWPRLFFGTVEKFVTIIDYKNPSGKIIPELEGKHIHRISREYTDNILQGLEEMQFVSNHLSKSYKQEIMNSPEFHRFLDDLLEVGESSKHTGIDTYPIATKLFNISLELLSKNAPEELKEELNGSVKRFVKFNNLAIRLGYKKSIQLELPEFLQQNIKCSNKD